MTNERLKPAERNFADLVLLCSCMKFSDEPPCECDIGFGTAPRRTCYLKSSLPPSLPSSVGQHKFATVSNLAPVSSHGYFAIAASSKIESFGCLCDRITAQTIGPGNHLAFLGHFDIRIIGFYLRGVRSPEN